jgi:hypothetical protein
MNPLAAKNRRTCTRTSRPAWTSGFLGLLFCISNAGCSSGIWDVEQARGLRSVTGIVEPDPFSQVGSDGHQFTWEGTSADVSGPCARLLVNMIRAPFIPIVGFAEAYGASGAGGAGGAGF